MENANKSNKMKDLFAKQTRFSVEYKGEKANLMKKILLTALLIPIVGFSSNTTLAQDIADQPCDAQYWRQMSARAWLEAEREIMQNQNLIFKPDSVLEYVCFDQFASVAAWDGGDIFTHTDYYGKKIITRELNPGALQHGITKVVSDALSAYKGNGGGGRSATQGGNFGHTFLGGRATYMDAEMTNSSFKPATQKQAYACQTMSKVWKAAKCANFIDNSNFSTTDGFYPFEAIKGHNGSQDVGGYADTIKETRIFPSYMACDDSDQGAAGTWADQLELAENKSNNLYKFQEPLGKIFEDVGKKLEPGQCGQPAIKTGVMVIIDGQESHEDGVCTNPGCTYTKGGTCS